MPNVFLFWKKVYDFDFPVEFEILGFLENPEHANPEHAWHKLKYYLIGGGAIIICIMVLLGAACYFIFVRKRPAVPAYQYVEMEEIQL